MKPPIADPFAPPDSPGAGLDTRVFRPNLWRIYFGNVLFALVLLPLFLWWSYRPEYMSLLIFLLLQVFGFVPIFAVLGAFLNPVKVNAMGIQGPLAVGFVEWSHIRSCRLFWLGPPYARVKLQGRTIALWVPLALQDRKGFARAVEEMAPVDNPLRVFLKKRGY